MAFVRNASTAVKNSITKVGLVGAAFNKGQKLMGVEKGPEAVRAGGLIENVKEFNQCVDIKDFGDVNEVQTKFFDRQLPKNMSHYPYFAATMRNLSDKVKQVLDEDRMCWTIGGDHSIAVGSISGHLRHNKNISLFWIDAHTDINTNLTSMSGNIHGMPVAILAKELSEYWSPLPGLDWLKQK